MDQLPQEILDHIVAFLPKSAEGGSSTLVALACTSRRLNRVAEAITFTSVGVAAAGTTTFDKIFASKPHRRGFLRYLTYRINLPTYSDYQCTEYETRDDMAKNNRVASQAVHRLFEILSRWDSGSATLKLGIHISSPTDDHRLDEKGFETDQNAVRIPGRRDLFERRWQYTFVQISDCASLPTVTVVRDLDFVGRHGRRVAPGSIASVTAKCPGITFPLWIVEMPEGFEPLYRDLREELALALRTSGLPLSADSLRIYLTGMECYGHHQSLPIFTRTDGVDALCEALNHCVGQHIKSFEYQGPVHPSLFWSPPVSESAPFWRSLESLTVGFDISCPSGHWYFKGKEDDPYYVRASDEPLPKTNLGHWPPGYGTVKEGRLALAHRRTLDPLNSDGTVNEPLRFRRVPNEDVIYPLIESFARALGQMPVLKYSCLVATIDTPDGSADWSITYGAPGEPIEYGPHAEAVPRFLLHVGDWRPKEEILEMFRDVGRRQHNMEAVIRFLPFATNECRY